MGREVQSADSRQIVYQVELQVVRAAWADSWDLTEASALVTQHCIALTGLTPLSTLTTLLSSTAAQPPAPQWEFLSDVQRTSDLMPLPGPSRWSSMSSVIRGVSVWWAGSSVEVVLTCLVCCVCVVSSSDPECSGRTIKMLARSARESIKHLTCYNYNQTSVRPFWLLIALCYDVIFVIFYGC